jgi:predicted secreted protein
MAAVDAFGTKWAMGDGAGPEVFTDVADVTNIGILDVKVDTIETSTHDSAEQWREFIGGMKDAGELKMEVNYDPAAHGVIFDAIGGDPRNHKITLVDAGAAVVTFAAVITGFQAGAPYDDKMSGSVTLKVSGKPTITP